MQWQKPEEKDRQEKVQIEKRETYGKIYPRSSRPKTRRVK
jgi:hypothetical protein